jgi:hypothetical protein
MDIKGAREKLQTEIIDPGVKYVTATVEDIVQEFNLRRDYIIRPEVLEYPLSEKTLGLRVKNNGDTRDLALTPHSLGQLYAKAEIPSTFASKLIEADEGELLTQLLSRLNSKFNTGGLLVREVGGTAKGILSPSYKRMDASPVFEGFIQTALENKYVPYKGSNTNYRYQIQFVYPEVFQPVAGEYVVYGLSLTTGDYGSQVLELELLALRIQCSNLHVGYDLFRRVHLGKRFNLDNDTLVHALSDRTHQLDSDTVASAISDVVRASTKQIEYVDTAIKKGADSEITPAEAVNIIRKKGFSKEIAEKVKTIYEADVPLELLPAGNNAWRLSNALSLIAKDKSLSADQRIDAEKGAMSLLVH